MAVMVAVLGWSGFLAREAEAAAAAPTSTTKVGDTVLNVVTDKETTVTALILDPAAAPGDPALAFVQTADSYVILVKNKVGDIIYNNDPTPIGFKVVSTDATTETVKIQLDGNLLAPQGNSVVCADFGGLHGGV